MAAYPLKIVIYETSPSKHQKHQQLLDHPCREPMVKMLKLASIFRSRNEASYKWLPFKHLKYIPFQADRIVSPSNAVKVLTMLDSAYSQSKRLTTALIESDDEVVQMAAKALRSRRFFYEPANSSLSVRASGFSFQECVVKAVESNNPYMDIRKSMEEMVEAYGLKASKIDWDYLEELLTWYLRMNRKKNHGFIIEAFIDVLTGPSSGSSYCSCCYDASASSPKLKEWWEIEAKALLHLQRREKIQNI